VRTARRDPLTGMATIKQLINRFIVDLQKGLATLRALLADNRVAIAVPTLNLRRAHERRPHPDSRREAAEATTAEGKSAQLPFEGAPLEPGYPLNFAVSPRTITRMLRRGIPASRFAIEIRRTGLRILVRMRLLSTA
jgi:hypothetical protein